MRMISSPSGSKKLALRRAAAREADKRRYRFERHKAEMQAHVAQVSDAVRAAFGPHAVVRQETLQ